MVFAECGAVFVRRILRIRTVIFADHQGCRHGVTYNIRSFLRRKKCVRPLHMSFFDYIPALHRNYISARIAAFRICFRGISQTCRNHFRSFAVCNRAVGFKISRVYNTAGGKQHRSTVNLIFLGYILKHTRFAFILHCRKFQHIRHHMRKFPASYVFFADLPRQHTECGYAFQAVSSRYFHGFCFCGNAGYSHIHKKYCHEYRQ